MTLQSLLSRRSSSIDENDFNNLIKKNLPSWSATWNVLLHLDSPKAGRRAKNSTTELHEKIWRKIMELVDEEEALIDLYTKAADAAKEREKKFRSKTAILMKQLKKDKNLITILKRPN